MRFLYFTTLFYNSKHNHSRWCPSVECQDCPLAIDLLTLFFETNLFFYRFLEGFKFYLLLFTHRLIASNRLRVSKDCDVYCYTISACVTLCNCISASLMVFTFLRIVASCFSQLFLSIRNMFIWWYPWYSFSYSCYLVHNSSLACLCT